jgi:hypothetical protein
MTKSLNSAFCCLATEILMNITYMLITVNTTSVVTNVFIEITMF